MDKNPMSINDVYYVAALCATPGLGRANLVRAIGTMGTAKALYQASERELEKLSCFTNKQISTFLGARNLDLANQLRLFCQKEGVRIVTWADDEYPELLRNTSDNPIALYVKGTIPEYSYGVAVVGSRECSEYGIKAASYFSAALANKGIPIISGGARGIDTAAHESCLKAGGQTIAVLGCGIDVAYPAENKELFNRIAEKGAVISEYPPGTPPLAYNFPARNRIVVGLSHGVLVTEARRKSGALITAHIAADEGREVFAVPGNIFSGRSLGCHDLLRKGAKMAETVQDILEEYPNWLIAKASKCQQLKIFDYQCSNAERLAAEQLRAAAQREAEERRQAKEKQLEEARQAKLAALSPATQRIYECIKKKAIGFEEIIELSGEAFMTVSMAVLDLQMANLIKEEGMQTYRRI